MYVFRVIYVHRKRDLFYLHILFITFTKYIMDNPCITKLSRFQFRKLYWLVPRKAVIKECAQLDGCSYFSCTIFNLVAINLHKYLLCGPSMRF